MKGGRCTEPEADSFLASIHLSTTALILLLALALELDEQFTRHRL